MTRCRLLKLDIGSVTDAKEQGYLHRFEVLFLRVYYGVYGRQDSRWGSGNASRMRSTFATALRPSTPGLNLPASHSLNRNSPGVNGTSELGTPLITSNSKPGDAAATSQSRGSGDRQGLGLTLTTVADRASDDNYGEDHDDLDFDQDTEGFRLVDSMSAADQERFALAITEAIRLHVHFPAACGDAAVPDKITFPRSYFLGIFPSCVSHYDFSDRNFALKVPRIALDAISILRNGEIDDVAIEARAAKDAAAAATTPSSIAERGEGGLLSPGASLPSSSRASAASTSSSSTSASSSAAGAAAAATGAK